MRTTLIQISLCEKGLNQNQPSVLQQAPALQGFFVAVAYPAQSPL